MLCNALSPSRLDESIQAQIQDRWADKYFKLQSDEEDAFREVFVKACPKFFSPVVSEYEDPAEQSNVDENEALNRQINMFLKDVAFQNRVFNVRSIAKLYNNLTLSVRFLSAVIPRLRWPTETRKSDGDARRERC